MTDLERAALLWLLEDRRVELAQTLVTYGDQERMRTVERFIDELRGTTDYQTPLRLTHLIRGGGSVTKP